MQCYTLFAHIYHQHAFTVPLISKPIKLSNTKLSTLSCNKKAFLYLMRPSLMASKSVTLIDQNCLTPGFKCASLFCDNYSTFPAVFSTVGNCLQRTTMSWPRKFLVLYWSCNDVNLPLFSFLRISDGYNKISASNDTSHCFHTEYF